ncbi:MAG: starch-binding protein, partial [Clostridiales bacterium]|nr:starch-binding protein [Clostridiales bacterium]
VYYTNSNRWANVYAYCWNYSTDKPKKAWPGEKLTSFATSDYGEKQFKIDVDYSQYDRIIFNDGNSGKTKDLVISGATSGYYGEDGAFTMGTENYGKVEYFTLTDTKNLTYLSGGKKKISVYTPPNYTSSKKYGVLYMFDGQNLYIAADGSGAEKNGSPERWAVDVAVTNLVQNGNDGVIIVGIDDADGHRDQELTMSLSFGTLTSLGAPQYGDFRNGKLDELGNFVKETVMPWVKSHYSVDASREKTGIAGSSSGGIAAYYLGLRDNDLYGYIGAFSPANGLFQASDWTKFYKGKNGFAAGKPKVYVYCGKNDHDLEDMLLPETKRIKSGLTSCGFSASNITENYVDGGTHNEVYWRIAFLEFLSKMVG